jgi:hypothetical protein
MEKGFQFIFSVMLVLLVTSVEAASINDYYPLQPGTVWNYTGTYGLATDRVVAEKVNINGVATTVVITDPDSSKLYGSNDSQGLRLHRIESPSDSGSGTDSITFNPPILISKPILVVGDRNTNAGIVDLIASALGTFSFSYSVVSTVVSQETVTVPAGIFETYKINYSFLISGIVQGQSYSFRQSGTFWFAEGIGAVKTETSQEGQFSSTRLTSTNITAGPVVAGTANPNQEMVYWRNTSSGLDWVYALNGSNVEISGILNLLSDQNWQMAGTNDFNGDGWKDILWRNQVTGENGVYLMNGTDIQSITSVSVVDTNWEIQSTDDLDGDGKADVLWRNQTTGEVGTYLMNGSQIKSIHSISVVADLNWQIKGTGDLDGGGKADVIWRNIVTGEVGCYLMNGHQIKSVNTIFMAADLNWQIKVVGDFDGDNKADIVWRNQASGENWMFQMNGHLIKNSQAIMTVTDTNWDIATSKDFDNDGKYDLFWRNSKTGQNWMFLMDGSAVKQSQNVNTVSDQHWKIAK